MSLASEQYIDTHHKYQVLLGVGFPLQISCDKIPKEK